MDIAAKRKLKWGSLFLVLFLLPFCAGGLIALFLAIQELFSPVRDLHKLIVLGGVGLTFCAFGFGLLYAMRAGGKIQRQKKARQALHPGQPWMWGEDWAAGRIKSNTRAAVFGIWILAIFWNLVSSPIVLIQPPAWEKNEYGFLALIFPVIGAGLLYWALLQTLRARRFGRTAFAMESVPAALGTELRGSIQTRLSPLPEDGVLLRLSCIRRTVSGSGKNRSTHESILWRDEQTIAPGSIMSGPGASMIPVRFTIPADGLESNAEKSDSGIFWFLSAAASLTGVDYKDEFEIPVFRTKDSPPAGDGPAFASLDAPETFATVTPAELAKAGIFVGPAPQGTEYHFAAARNKSAAAGVTVFLLIWTGAIWLMLRLGAPVLFPIFFGLFELLLLLFAVDQWFGSTRITIGQGLLRKQYSLLGIPFGARTMPASDISRLRLKVGMQSGGRSGTPYYDLRAVLLNGKEQSLAGSVKNKLHADWLAAHMTAALGLPSTS